MKRKAEYFIKDSSFTSVSILKEKVSLYLERNFNIKDAWFVDFHEMHREDRYDEIIDIVFFGDFVRKFLEGSLWPFTKYRFWVISEVSQKVISELMQIPAESIAVIPRNELFIIQEAAKTIELDNFQNLFYVGQIRPEKNIQQLIWTNYFLQKEFNINSKMNFVGSFSTVEYRELTIAIVEKLKWNIKPIFHGEISNFQYRQHANKDSTLINLSTFLYEDFNLSASMAQEAGWSLVVSAWGGHLDLKGNNLIKIPYCLICENESSNTEIKLKAYKTASFIYDNLQNALVSESEQPKSINLKLPVPIYLENLNEIRLRLAREWGPALYFILRQNNFLALDFNKGYQFFDLYRKIFGNKVNEPKKIIILTNSSNRDDEVFLQLKSEDLTPNTYFMPVKHLAFKQSWIQLLNCEKIIIQREVENIVPSFMETLKIMENKCSKI